MIILVSLLSRYGIFYFHFIRNLCLIYDLVYNFTVFLDVLCLTPLKHISYVVLII
jgi:hypothetical protein